MRRTTRGRPSSDDKARAASGATAAGAGNSGKSRSSASAGAPSGEKLQKVLARQGLGSRRELEGWIESGRVSVNGTVATLGVRVGPKDVLRVDGNRLGAAPAAAVRVIAYNKPEGEVCTRHDPEGRSTVFDRLPRLGRGRWISVGRLDINTQGLLLFTNDGELCHRLTHPSYTLEREYAARVLGEVPKEALERLKNGVELDDGVARFTSIRHAGGEGANQWYHVSLREGRNREVHRLWESQDVRLSRLVRIRYGPIRLPSWLRTGRHTELDTKELALLLESVRLRRTLRPDEDTKRARERKRVARKGRRRD